MLSLIYIFWSFHATTRDYGLLTAKPGLACIIEFYVPTSMMLVRYGFLFVLPYITIMFFPKVRCALLPKRDAGQLVNVAIAASMTTSQTPILTSSLYPAPAVSSTPPLRIYVIEDDEDERIQSIFQAFRPVKAHPPVKGNRKIAPTSIRTTRPQVATITPPPALPGTLPTAQTDAQANCIPYTPCNIFFQVRTPLSDHKFHMSPS